MDSQRFDRLSRFLAANRSRRQLFAGVAGGLVAGFLTPFRRGRVIAACPPGQSDCGGICVDLLWNKYNCGACFNPCVGQWGCCSGTCADLYSDPYNCGGCGNACAAGEACCSGICVFDLNFNWYNCGACGTVCATNEYCCSGNCVDIQTDTFNCGSCGNACVGVPGPGQSSIGQCVNGQCEVVCEPGYYNCGQGCSDLLSDSANCGACWNACPEGQLCQNGNCVATCPPDLTDCNGVCVDTAWDPANCGGCAIGCASQAGWGLCCFGICVDPQTDPHNCGGCEIACAAGQTCVDGVCTDGAQPPPPANPAPTATATPSTVDKWKLWTGKTQLRGAHILQRRVDPDRDDPALGPGPVGPAFTSADFARLASFKANYVEVVHPVPLTQRPPYKPYGKLRDNLDHLVDQAYRAGLFVVIGFRNGPGRPERALDADVICQAGGCLAAGAGGGTVTLWTDKDAQEVWAAEWQGTARRYQDHPAVVGYDLIVAPDAPSLSTWEDLAGRLSEAIRDADPDTPLLVSVPSNPSDLLDFRPTSDDRTVYRLDLFPPDRYLLQAHADPTALIYPGRLDPVRDGEEGRFDRAWIEDRTLALEAFARRHDVPIAIGAYGTSRWQPGAVDYLTDALAIAEAAKLNHGLWLWSPEGWTGEDAFDVERGTDPTGHEAVPNDLLNAVRATWKKNKSQQPGV
jgi:hypothetical protein